MVGAIAVARGCGSRVAGGTYWELGFGPGGKPVEAFLVDPPIPVPDELIGQERGVALIERDGVFHVVDRVGRCYYPNVADFVEEVRRFGVSRRIDGINFARITRDSRLLLWHDRADVLNWQEYGSYSCPTEQAKHAPACRAECCAGFWWRDLEPREAEGHRATQPVENRPYVTREMPSFRYHARVRPETVQPLYVPAWFASFPASRLVVVQGGGEPGERAWQRVQQSALPVALVDK